MQEMLANRTANTREFQERRILLESSPRALFVELTRNCNLHCWMCREKRIYDPSLNMPFKLFRHIADLLFPYADVVDLRGWGESLILPDFVKCLEYTSRFPCKIKLYTNLNVFNDNLLEELATQNAIVAVSFDACSEKTFQRIRRGASFERILHNLNRMLGFFRSFHGTTENVYLSTVVQKDNLTEIKGVVKLAGEMEIDLVKLFPLISRVTDSRNLFHYLDNILAMLSEVKDTAASSGVTVELGAALHPSLVNQKKVIDLCVRPWMYCYITCNGNIGFCDHLIGRDEFTIPHDFKSDFAKAWNSDFFATLRYSHLMRFAEKRDICAFRICNWCYLYRYNDMEHLVYPPSRKSTANIEETAVKPVVISENRTLEFI